MNKNKRMLEIAEEQLVLLRKQVEMSCELAELQKQFAINQEERNREFHRELMKVGIELVEIKKKGDK